MKEKLTHRERIETILAGEMPDRYAASFWRHYFHLENSAEGTVAAMLDFQNKFDWDFIKINPRADYHVQDWGLRLEYSTDEFTKHAKLAFPILSPDHWSRIEPLPTSAPSLAEHLEVVRRLRKEVGADLPLLMTVFTPLSLAGRMLPDRDILISHIRQHPDLVHSALEAITETFSRYVEELRNAGADGIFYATTHWASADKLTFDEYEQFGLPYDLRVIGASGEDAINVLHVCGANNFLAQLAPYDYLCAIYNWDSDHPSNCSLEQGRDLLDFRTLMGGFPYNETLVGLSTEEVNQRTDWLQDKFSPAELIIGPGCAIPPETPEALLQAIRSRL